MLERVMITKIRSHTSNKVDVKLIDVGSTMTVEHSDLLTLPNELMEIPAQAVEVFVTGIRPLDNDVHYHEESLPQAHVIAQDAFVQSSQEKSYTSISKSNQ